jgi:hypothetical protein
MKRRVTIDIDEADTAIYEWAESHTDTYRNGILHVDELGVHHMYYKSRNDLITFYDPMELPG